MRDECKFNDSKESDNNLHRQPNENMDITDSDRVDASDWQKSM